jgi:molybdopterin converting factor small subunit
VEQYAVAAGMLIVNLVAAVIGGTWILGRTSSSLSEKIDAAKLELERRVNTEADQLSRNVGETVSALRQKLSDIELWNRDNFVNRRTFDTSLSDTREMLRRLEDKIEQRFNSVDRKLSKMSGEPSND